jgi:hypothetical protein
MEGAWKSYDCEYKRNGNANLFVFLDVHRPWRKVKVTESRASTASSSKVQRARPKGGFEQAVATNKASSLSESLRHPPGRGSSLSAASRLPSTKRRLVRYTVDAPAPMFVAISSSLAPASAASKTQNPTPVAAISRSRPLQ